MTKEGGSIKTWKRRYFILKNYELLYFNNVGEKEEEALGKISLKTASRVEKAEKRKRPNCFEIYTPSRVYAFSCEIEQDMNEWVSILQREKDKLGPTVEKVGVEDFDLLNLVGKGSFGKVMQVKKKGYRKDLCHEGPRQETHLGAQ